MSLFRQPDWYAEDLSANAVVVAERHGENQSWQRASSGNPGQGFIGDCLLDYFLRWAGFFHLLPHRVQVVCGRNHGEEQHQNAAEKHEGTNPMEARAILGIDGLVSPHPDGGHRQGQPKKIE